MNKLLFEQIERKILTKKPAQTNPEYGCNPKDRPVQELINYGIVNIDKTKGPSSHQVSSYVKNILNLDKAGHSGTLDPGVTGVLPTALGRATRILQTLLKAGKEYICLMHLHKEADNQAIETAFTKFTGTITQLPPVRSAIKRQERKRAIYYLDILEIKEKDVLFKVGCEAGTYIRKLCIHPNTEILTKKGIMIASDFYSNPQIIYSYREGKMIERKPSANQRIPSPSKLIKITMDSGISFNVTPDHELFASKKEGYKMVEARKLRTQDYLVKSLELPKYYYKLVITDLLDDYYLIPQKDIINKCKKAFINSYGSIRAMYRELKLDRKSFLNNSSHAITIRHLKLAGIYEKVKDRINEFKTQKGSIIKIKDLDEDFFYLLGLIASDGNNTKEKKTARYTRIKFHNNNEELINVFLRTYKKLFPNVPISKKKIKANLFQLDSANSFMATVAAKLGIKSPQKESDLSPIVNLKPLLIKSFLRGYFEGDGSVYYKEKKRVKGHYAKIVLHTVSYSDAKRLHKMLLVVGIANKIFKRRISSKLVKKSNNGNIYDVTIGNIAAEKKFIKEIGTNHPIKLERFKKISKLKNDAKAEDHYYIGFHYKNYIRRNKSKLHKMGGNLNRILTSDIPITRGFYRKASLITNLPLMDYFIIEKIKSIEYVDGTDFVYDMTVPETHNFLIETGFVSSNCYDLGQELGTGAHMAQLRRTKAGPFNETTLITLQDLKDAYHYYKEQGNEKYLKHIISPVEFGVSHLPKIWVSDSAVTPICHGFDVALPGIIKLNDTIKEGTLVAVMTLKDELIALGDSRLTSNEMQKKTKGIAIKIKKVFMEPGVYPKLNKNKALTI